MNNGTDHICEKTLIVYYSLEGNTDFAAKKIAENGGFDLLRIVPVKQYPSKGFRKFLWGGKSAVMAETPDLEPYEFRADKYERIIIGFPVWAGNVTPPIRTFVRDNDLKGKKIAAFACESGAGAEKAFEKLKAAIGIDHFEADLILIDPKTKPDQANEQKIREFCAKLRSGEKRMPDKGCSDGIVSPGKIYISYRKRDRSSKKAIFDELTKQGFQVFNDDLLMPGENYVNEITSQFEKACGSGAVVFLLSEYSLEPSNFQTRIEFPMAVQRGAEIIPVWIGGSSWDSVKEDFYDCCQGLDSLQIIDGEGDISKVLGKVVEAIEGVTGDGSLSHENRPLSHPLSPPSHDSSISISVSKDGLDEEMSLLRTGTEEAASRPVEGVRPEAISNEKIQNGDEILETYRVTSNAIHGGMGSVWRVHHKNWDVDLAMKRPQPKFFAEGSARRKEQFVAECENWINLGLHPNIVSCYYVREIGGVPAIFSEWMEGGSLKDRMRDGSLYKGSEEEIRERILDIAIQAARGLKYSHEKGLVHQDVKPGNLLLTRDWDAKVADFGLAKARSGLSDGDLSRPTGYTIEYCPREQAEGSPAEAWMDVYAWALTVFEMYAGERFWSKGANAFPRAFGDMDLPEPDYRIDPPQALFDAWWEDYYSKSGKWRSFAAYEQLLLEIYREQFGREYPRSESKAAADVADAINNRALSFLDLGKTEEAEELWEKALELHPRHVNCIFNRALSRFRKERADFAETKEMLAEIEDEDVRNEALEQLEKEYYGQLVLPEEKVPIPDELSSHLLKGNRFFKRERLMFTEKADFIYGFTGEHFNQENNTMHRDYVVYDTHRNKNIFRRRAGYRKDGPDPRPHISLSQSGDYAAVDFREQGPGSDEKFRTSVIDLHSGDVINRFGSGGGVLSPDGRYIGFLDRASAVIETTNKNESVQLNGIDGNARFIDFTHQGHAVLYEPRTKDLVFLAEPDKGAFEPLFRIPSDHCPSRMFQPGRNICLFQDEAGFLLCDVENRKVIRKTEDSEHAAFAALTGDKRYIVLIFADYRNVPTGKQSVYFSKFAGDYVIQDVYVSREVYDCEIWDLKEQRILEKGKKVDERTEDLLGKLLYILSHPETLSYIPGVRAEYRLNTIESTGVRLTYEKQFRECLAGAEESAARGSFAESFSYLDRAMHVPGFESSPEPFRLRAEIGKNLKRKFAKRIVPVSETIGREEMDLYLKKPEKAIKAGAFEEKYAETAKSLREHLLQYFDDGNRMTHWECRFSYDDITKPGFALICSDLMQIFHVRGDPFDRADGSGATRDMVQYYDCDHFSNRIIHKVGAAVLDTSSGKIVYLKEELYEHDNHYKEAGKYSLRNWHLCINNSGEYLLFAAGKQLKVILIAEDKTIGSMELPDHIYICRYLEDDAFILVQCENGLVRIIRQSDMTWAEYDLSGELYGEMIGSTNDVFIIKRNNEYYPCWIEWEYETV